MMDDFQHRLRSVARATGYLLRENRGPADIRAALREIGEAFGADAAYISEYRSGDAVSAVHRYDWSAQPSRPVAGNRAPFAFPPGSPSPEADLSAPDVDRPSQGSSQGSALTMTLPMTVAGRTWGKLLLETDDPSMRWSRDEVALLEMMAQNFGAVLAGHAVSAGEREGGQSSTANTNNPAEVRRVVLSAMKSAGMSDKVTSAVAVLGPDGSVLMQNDHMTRLTGAEAEQFNAAGGWTSCLTVDQTRRTVDRALGEGIEMETRARVSWSENPAWLQIAPIPAGQEGAACSLLWVRPVEEPSLQDTPPPTLNLERRVRAERALVEASKLLVASEACDYDRLLEIVGTATGARYAYLVVIIPSDVVSFPDDEKPAYDRNRPIQLDTYTQYEWFSPDAPASTAETRVEEAGPTFAVPILSSDEQLLGYVGIEYAPSAAPGRDEDARILSVLGDMLCAYLQRQISEEALRRSEQRYRHFVDTISEAIWRIDFAAPISTDEPTDAQVDALLAQGVVAECNLAMARLFGLDTPKKLVGQSIERITEIIGRQIVRALVTADYRLRQHEYIVRVGNERERYFVINTVGVREDGQLQSLWGSCTEVTERVELERRMVASLERQQQRIGRDLHDRVGQQLAGTRMLAQNLADRHFPDDDQPGRKMIDRIIRYVQEATQHVNDLQRGVMPVQVDRDGLAQALVELSSRIDRLEGVSCVYSHDGTTDVRDQETKLQLYRIVQEATRNAVIHGSPSRVEIALFSEDGDVVLQVRDDGIGFEGLESQPKEASFGLHSMQYRAHAIGAAFDLDTAPGRGTVVTCRLSRLHLDGPSTSAA